MTTDYAAIARRLRNALTLTDPPIAVCLAAAAPSGVPKWTGAAPAGCAFWQEAAQGALATQARDHEHCAIGTFTHNLDATSAHEADRRDALQVFKNSGRAALSLGCCGARAYLDVLTDDKAVFALPGNRLDVYSTRISELARANAVLTTFHQIRRRDVAAGKNPTVRDSLAAMPQ